jgi:hypothetical protein
MSDCKEKIDFDLRTPKQAFAGFPTKACLDSWLAHHPRLRGDKLFAKIALAVSAMMLS